jgi:uncharacterized membrane protein
LGRVGGLCHHHGFASRCLEKTRGMRGCSLPDFVSDSSDTPKPNITPAESAEQVAQRLRDSHLRSVIKAVSWRIIGTLDTILISYLWTGIGKKAFAIGGSEVLTKVGLYYLHERVWASIPLGTVRRLNPGFSEEEVHGGDTLLRDSKLRSLLKAVSWRVVGTVDTILVSYFWTGDTTKALVIGGTDVLTKIFLYYLHERAWARIPLGTIRKIFKG